MQLQPAEGKPNHTEIRSGFRGEIESVRNASSRLARALIYLGLLDYDSGSLPPGSIREMFMHGFDDSSIRDSRYRTTMRNGRLLIAARQLSGEGVIKPDHYENGPPNVSGTAMSRANEIYVYFAEQTASRPEPAETDPTTLDQSG